MIALFKHPRYDFIGRRGWAYAVSITITASALVSLLLQGLRYDLDFTGGTLIQVRFQHPPEASQLRAGAVPHRPGGQRDSGVRGSGGIHHPHVADRGHVPRGRDPPRLTPVRKDGGDQ